MKFDAGILLSGVYIFFLAGTLYAGSFFTVHPDQSVSIDDQTFSSMKEYVKSDWFRTSGKRCGTRPLKDFSGSKIRRLSTEDCTTSFTQIQQEYYPDGVVLVIPVYFHVIYDSGGTGNISDQAIQDQMRVLNEDFRAMTRTLGSSGFDTMIQFELKAVTRTQNDAWFNDIHEDEYKQALGVSPENFLNVYSNTASGYLGYSYFPQTSAGTFYDGVVMNYETIGGRNNGFDIYDQGRTLVHEIGHYLGLEHTFASIGSVCGATYNSGDLIVDTPPESEEHYDCVLTQTCGCPDPIYNYMNYTPDSCMNQFTEEQGNRMVCSLMNYRPGAYRSVKLSAYLPGIMTPLLLKN